jgi:hypothetical protein
MRHGGSFLATALLVIVSHVCVGIHYASDVAGIIEAAVVCSI